MLQKFFIYDFRIYFILRSQERNCYQLYSIDMRHTNANSRSLTKLFEYNFEEVEDKPFLDFFVRGKSRERDQQKNLKLIVFLLHEGKLYQWIEGLTIQLVQNTSSEKLEFLSKN